MARQFQADFATALTAPHQIQRAINRRPVEIAPGRLNFTGTGLQQPREHRLRNILRVSHVSRNPIHSAKNPLVMLPEHLLHRKLRLKRRITDSRQAASLVVFHHDDVTIEQKLTLYDKKYADTLPNVP